MLPTYTKVNPMREVTDDPDGTQTARVARIGDQEFMDFSKRFPAFVGLARYTGGYVATNDDGMTLERAMDAGKLNFTVKFQDTVKVPLLGDDGVTEIEYPYRGTYGEWPDGTRRGMGMVLSRYQLVQPVQVGELGQAIIDESGANVVAAGIYGKPMGSRTYLAFKLPEGLTVGGQDRYDLYLTVLNSYNGTSSVTGLFAPIRFDCTNMTTAHFGQNVSNRFTFRHSGQIEKKIDDARQALGIAGTWTERFAEKAEELLATPLAGEALTQFVAQVLPTPETVTTESGEKRWANRRLEMLQLITQADTCEFGRGTAYAALQGAQEWVDWFAATKTHDPHDSNVSRYLRTLGGSALDEVKLRAARLLRVGS